MVEQMTDKTILFLCPGHFYPHCPGIRQSVIALIALILLATAPGRLKADEQETWTALKSGNHFAILRHAIAPGTGDPDNFKIGDCSTQRNLSDAGRQQAALIGERFRARGINRARVLSSQWCRCLETAKLLALGSVEPLPALNSFFNHFEREKQQSRQLKKWLDGIDLKIPLVLVTHQVNITALTGIFPASGEMVVIQRIKPGSYQVIGRIQF